MVVSGIAMLYGGCAFEFGFPVAFIVTGSVVTLTGLFGVMRK
jgi:hypothetical protein